ncbi:hypothetical protein AA21291_1721 [Swaminathania salitolerans LMG 21291]|uniref:Uncharacterized protein n=1 Tax=Swaminathania salitolerans TaxID=182838 RepID=A0A511BSW4_9PROT|nr:hypothetical protein AA21291_1721 [Swaminathania salitolerans LMG 21291]GEL02913.1 hypothetical protein SSA02_20760 [Swaminathania salitolerans]
MAGGAIWAFGLVPAIADGAARPTVTEATNAAIERADMSIASFFMNGPGILTHRSGASCLSVILTAKPRPANDPRMTKRKPSGNPATAAGTGR